MLFINYKIFTLKFLFFNVLGSNFKNTKFKTTILAKLMFPPDF